MKLSYMYFLAKSSLKGNRKSFAVMFITILFVIALTVVTSLSSAVVGAVNGYKDDYFARSFMITPYNRPLDDKVISQISKIRYVENVFIQEGFRSQGFSIKEITGNNALSEHISKSEEPYVSVMPLFGESKIKVIAGESLEESPNYSCIIPDRFYPLDFPEGVDEFVGSLDYLRGEDFVGETLQLYQDHYELTISDNDEFNDILELSSNSIELKIVGVYQETGYSNGYPDTIFISSETGKLIQNSAITNYTGKHLDRIKNWVNNPQLHNYYVVADDYENLDYIRKELMALNVDCDPTQELGINPSVMSASNTLSVVSILLLAITFILSALITMMITMMSVMNRKGEIGLMKAVGYLRRQIFSVMYFEQLILTIRGFLIGGFVSIITVSIINYITGTGQYSGRIYTIPWDCFLLYLGLSLLFSIVLPLMCMLISIGKLSKIQPQDAMM